MSLLVVLAEPGEVRAPRPDRGPQGAARATLARMARWDGLRAFFGRSPKARPALAPGSEAAHAAPAVWNGPGGWTGLPAAAGSRGRAGAWLAVAGLWLAVSLEGSDPCRGLWVGQVTLNFVNEVTVPLDQNNVPIAPDPQRPTPTHDQANLRLILHVSGGGQVSLLKDVAVLNRAASTEGSAGSSASNLQVRTESDVALVTDPRLYGEFSPQPAQRYASAVFDFGDSKATQAVEEVLNRAAEEAAASVANSTLDFSSATGRSQAEAAAKAAAESATGPIADHADVAQTFFEFLDFLNRARVDQIALSSTEASLARTEAEQRRDQSFYHDTRPVDMVDAIAAAVEALAPDADDAVKKKAAQTMAAAYADLANDYHRFLAGQRFGAMIDAAGQAAAAAAVADGATEASIRAAVLADGTVNDAKTEALRIQVSAYDDSRAMDAVGQVLEAVIASAVAALPAAAADQDPIATAAAAAGRTELADNVARFPVSAAGPTSDYTAFVRSTRYASSSGVAAEAAAAAAVAERSQNTLWTADSLKKAARLAAAEALSSALAEAALTLRHELPLEGHFGPGLGDARLRWEIQAGGGAPLSADAALKGTIYLPANHPTNPFRHRRNPEHATGVDITRSIRLDFDGSPGDVLPRAGYGVDRITGVYREEVFGLHKRLGPQQDTGLIVEGRFVLNRVSLIDALNAH